MNLQPSAIVCFLAAVATSVIADVHVTNFTTIGTTTSASGVWRNHTLGVDSGTAVSVSVSGGTISPTGSGTTLNGTFSWADTTTPVTNYFEPNFNGDRLAIDIQPNSTATVIVTFNSMIIDPTLLISGLTSQTLASITNPCTLTGQSSNMAGNLRATLTAQNFSDPLFGTEAAGSALFRGAWSCFAFSVTNQSFTADDVRKIGFCIASSFAPTDEASAISRLRIETVDAFNSKLDWERIEGVQVIEILDTDKKWIPFTRPDPQTQSFCTLHLPTFGRTNIYRGKAYFSSPPQTITTAMQTHLTNVGVNEFPMSNVVAWLPGRPFLDQSTFYQNGIAVYRQETIFGIKTLQARALIEDGVVKKWVFALSGLEIN